MRSFSPLAVDVVEGSVNMAFMGFGSSTRVASSLVRDVHVNARIEFAELRIALLELRHLVNGRRAIWEGGIVALWCCPWGYCRRKLSGLQFGLGET